MSKKVRRRKRVWVAVYIALPLLLLAVDLSFFPLFESRAARTRTNIESLVRTGRQSVGRIRLHEIVATLDTLDDPAFRPEVRGRPNAIVIPCFVDRLGNEPTIGALGKYVQERLNALSPGDSAHFSAILESGRVYTASVNDLELHIVPWKRAAFPFDHIFVVALASNSSHGTGDEGIFASAVPRLMQLAAANHIMTLVLPAVGYNWENKNSISFDSLYEPLFSGLGNGGGPKTIVLDLYREWPTFAIEHAVGAINSGIDHFFLANPTTSFYQQDMRLLLMLVAVCLFASRRYLTTFKSFAIIASGYVTLCIGASALIDRIATGWSGVSRTVVQMLLFAALACLFPIIVRWKADQVFHQSHTDE